MLPRTKYNRFRNDSVTSVDDLLHSLSVSGGGGKVSAARATPAAAPYLVSGEALHKAPDDGPGSLGHLLHKVSHLKLSSSGLRGLSSAARERAGARLSGSCSAPSLAAPDGSAPPAPRAPAESMSAARKGRPGDEPLPRPPRGAPHASDQVLGPGVTYVVKYLGCIEVLRSMRSLDFSTRTQITRCSLPTKGLVASTGPLHGPTPGFVDSREAISRVCEAVPGAKGAFKKRKPPSKTLSSILGKSNLQFAGMSISLTISTASLNLRTPDSKQIIANHHMQSISFASGGDPDTTDYVAYVAKDPVNRRACHILECCDGLAQDVIGSIGQAFELRFKQYLQCPSKIPALQDRSGRRTGSSTTSAISLTTTWRADCPLSLLGVSSASSSQWRGSSEPAHLLLKLCTRRITEEVCVGVHNTLLSTFILEWKWLLGHPSGGCITPISSFLSLMKADLFGHILETHLKRQVKIIGLVSFRPFRESISLLHEMMCFPLAGPSLWVWHVPVLLGSPGGGST
ncbi:SHC-transforming protein 3 isoform X5 [Castor canadensis]|uniref:SHC-transforming protein 3 isoform X5 n=1 Tax=Castor canadensis TaxID=51338 RepID=A0AC58KUC7_CASCN